MKKVFNSNFQAGSKKTDEPRLIGDILAEMFSSAGSGWFRNTDLCVDIKTFLCRDRIAKIGKDYAGVLCRDTDDHYSFVETATPVANAIIRNPHVFEGKYINVTRRLMDGHIRFNFKEVDFGGRFNPMGFAIGVMKEIIMAFKCLGEESRLAGRKGKRGELSPG